jgi:hypothetical protein
MIVTLNKLFILITTVLILSSCASRGSAPALRSGDKQPVDTRDPQEIVEELSETVLNTEKENHEMRRRIFELQTEMNLPRDTYHEEE